MYSKYKLNNYWASMLMVLIILLLFAGGYGITGFASEKLAIVCMLSFMSCKLINGVKLNKTDKKYVMMYSIIIVYLVFNYIHSYDQVAARPYLLRFFFLFLFLNLHYSVKYLQGIIKYSRYYMIIVAVVYIISFPLLGRDSGIYQSYQNTALNLSLGLGLFLPDLFYEKGFNYKNIILIGILFLAILLTGKRTFFIIPVLMFFIIALLSDDFQKYKKLSIILIIGIAVLLVASIISPALTYSIQRLLETGQDSTLSYRTYFWSYAIDLWKKNKMFGIGFGCYVAHIKTGGVNLAKYGYINAYDAHNIYYQMLAEIGIVGLVLFSVFFLIILINTFKQIKMLKLRNSKYLLNLNLVSIYFQIWFLVYGITGNPLYLSGQLFAYFFGVSICITISHILKGYEVDITKQ